ncbi:Argininosuccinate lyase [Hydrogenophaga sp. T4]|nr:Argininosuccinate lyase [Hydrogenophaga sp. T4]
MRLIHSLFAAAMFASMALHTHNAFSQEKFPSKAMRLIVPFAAGGGNDAVARLLAENMSKRLGQPIVVENRTGAGGNIGTDFVAKAPADGYTLVHVANTVVVNPFLYKTLPFDVQSDLAPVGLIATAPLWVLANPTSNINSLAALAAQIKGGSKQLSYATPGTGTPHHFAMELFTSRLGGQLMHVPYKGAGPALTDVLGGHVPLLVSTPQSVNDMVKSGRLNLLATMEAKRSEVQREVPSAAELLSGFEVSIWHGLMAPSKTPPQVMSFLSDVLAQSLADPQLQKKLQAIGFSAQFESASVMKSRIETDLKTWKQVAKNAGIVPE